jgi:hypothetical protein
MGKRTIMELILASMIATAGASTIENHFDNVKKEKIEQVMRERKENMLDRVAKYIQKENAEYWKKDKGTLSYERAYDYAKWIYEESGERGIPYVLALAIPDHETRFKNGTTDKNLKNKSYGISAINESNHEYIKNILKKNGKEFLDISGEELLNFPREQIRWYLEFIAHKKKVKNRRSIEEVLAYDYNPYKSGPNWNYVEKVNERRQKIQEVLSRS